MHSTTTRRPRSRHHRPRRTKLTSHGGADELMQWLAGFKRAPRQPFVVHGNPEATVALRFRIGNERGWQASVPAHSQAVEV